MKNNPDIEAARKGTLKYYGGLSKDKVLSEFRKWDIVVLQQLNDIAHPKDDRVVHQLIQKVLTERKSKTMANKSVR